ncbi:hypothetical protein GCM10010360_40580 [Streptomyces nogalater]
MRTPVSRPAIRTEVGFRQISAPFLVITVESFKKRNLVQIVVIYDGDGSVGSAGAVTPQVQGA